MAKILRYNYKTQDEALDSRLDELEAKVILHEGQETVAADIDNRVGSAVAALTNNEKTGSIDQEIANLQNQIDDAINTWFYSGVPTLLNQPASQWTTDDEKNVHLGDLYYDTATGYCYRFMVVNEAYSWGLIKDTEIATALANAAAAQATADSKAMTFIGGETPSNETEPANEWTTNELKALHEGDLYFDETLGRTYRYTDNGDGYEWVRIKDADITALEEAIGATDEDVARAQETADSKAMTFAGAEEPTLLNEPAVNWDTDEELANHEGDLYFNTETGYTYRFTYDEDEEEYSWLRIKDSDNDTAQATADSKAMTFYGADVPTLENAPANGWETEDYEKHVGDLYFTADGATYRFDGEKWVGVGHDGVTTYTGHDQPVLGTNPAWDEADYPNHDKDLYFDVDTGAHYFFNYDAIDGTGEWKLVSDAEKVNVDQGIENAGHHLFVDDSGLVSNGIAKELYLQDASGDHTFTISIDAEGGLMVSEIVKGEIIPPTDPI